MQKICDVKGLSDAKVDKILAAANALAPIAGWTNALTLTHKVTQRSIWPEYSSKKHLCMPCARSEHSAANCSLPVLIACWLVKSGLTVYRQTVANVNPSFDDNPLVVCQPCQTRLQLLVTM
jgi:hypothetical protein